MEPSADVIVAAREKGAAPAGSIDLARRQAGPLEAGLGSGVRSSNNIVISGDTAGSREQREVGTSEQVLRDAQI